MSVLVTERADDAVNCRRRVRNKRRAAPRQISAQLISILIRAGQTDWAASTVVNLGIGWHVKNDTVITPRPYGEGPRLQEYGDDIRVAAYQPAMCWLHNRIIRLRSDYYDVVERYAGKYPGTAAILRAN